jgi:hypothetical protein
MRTVKQTRRVVVSRTPDDVKIDINEIPPHEMDALCRAILGLTEKAFSDLVFAADYDKQLAPRKCKARRTA